VTVFFPDGVSSLGRDTWTFLIAAANKAAVTAAEVNAATGCNIQLAMRPGFGLDADTAKIDDRRLGSFVTYQSFGVTNRTFADAILIDRPQDAPAAATRKHLDVLVEGQAGFLLNRRGFGSASENWVAWIATHRYLLIPATVGPQTPIPAAEEGGQFEVKVSFVVTGPIVYGVIA
jgi:hypothetical protein